MTFLAEPKGYAPQAFAAFVHTLAWREWRPRFITLHNTGVPSLATWMDPAHSALQRIVSQKHYERDILHWHAGVHLFVAQDLIWNLCDLTQVGVSVSCWNHLTLGIEMVGDYAAESFESGPGAQVRDNAVAALAVLHRKLELRPDGFRLGVRGLHFHKECRRDHHDCPGRNVVKADVVARVLAQMAAIEKQRLLEGDEQCSNGANNEKSNRDRHSVPRSIAVRRRGRELHLPRRGAMRVHADDERQIHDRLQRHG